MARLRLWRPRSSLDTQSPSWSTCQSATNSGLEPMQRQRYAALEAKTVQAASGVLCSSRWSAAELSRRYGRSDVGVAIPGVTPAPVARGTQDSGPPRILSVASLTPTKDQLTLVHALAQLADLPWTAALIGSDQADPDYAARLRAEIVAAGLGDRILVPGALTGSALDQKWDAADLARCYRPGSRRTAWSSSKRWLAASQQSSPPAPVRLRRSRKGRPSTASATPGTSVPAGDSGALAAVLRRWLTEPMLRRTWRQAALARRDTLPGWQQTAAGSARLPVSPAEPAVDPAGSPPASPPTPRPVPPPSAGSSPS